jgi:tRNA nucleotidyltransferase (CCA-adding enzyme)
MLLSELLLDLDNIAKNNNIVNVFIVGGLPRDWAFKLSNSIKDIDVTTGDEHSLGLAIAAGDFWKDANFKIFDDGHSSLVFKNITIDFSNNFNLPGIEEELMSMGIEKPNNLEKELYSRDFTINTLLQPIDLTQKPYDITGKALSDIENKILRTPVNPELTIGHDSRRILRALRLVVKFDLTIEDSLKEAILKYRGGVSELPINHIKKQINQMLRMNPEKTIDLLSEFKLLPIIPLSKLMVLESTKRHMVQNLLDSWEL